MSFSTALIKVSRDKSPPLGGVHDPLHVKRFSSSDELVKSVWFCWKKNYFSLAKSFISAIC